MKPSLGQEAPYTIAEVHFILMVDVSKVAVQFYCFTVFMKVKAYADNFKWKGLPKSDEN
ncbi:hypothetical protein Patl1_28504 [Pistacia atlantica]|uniref:Uncharacterized protein n=1 Tax=Pistacia atlantica TaxID=434234 RepID=A0ACC1BGS5_9ROSI|nr:hypothetical protein Patl1_28504 [Pistacia atlantica]